MRDGELVKIFQENLVPGDIVHIEARDKLPADVRLIMVNGLKTNVFALTGESVHQGKQCYAIKKESPLDDRNDMAYAGTTVTTGIDMETGKITGMTKEAD